MDYNVYRFSKNELIIYGVQGLSLTSILVYCFYGNWYFMIMGVPILFVYFKYQKRQLIAKRKERLRGEFKDSLQSLGGMLEAGYIIEKALPEVKRDLKLLYGENSLMAKEFQIMERKVKNKTTIEHAFLEFAKASQIEEIKNFADILVIAKRSGGDLIKMIRNTGGLIVEKIDIEREIQTILAARKYEQRIMNLIPIGIILYLKVGCRGLLDPLYGNAVGIGIMTACLILYILAYLLSETCLRIKV